MKLIEQSKILLQRIIVSARKRPVWSSIGAVILVGLVIFILGGNNSTTDYDIESVVRRDVISLVDVTGKVRSPDKVNLGLERGGKISKIEVNVGDKVLAGKTLIVTNNLDLWARLDEAKANLALEQLNLEEAKGTSVIDENSAFTNLTSALQDAYISTEDAIQNKLSGVFRGSTSSNTKLGIATDLGNIIDLDLTISERLDIGYARKRLDKALLTERDLVTSVTRDNILDAANTSEQTLLASQDLLDVISNAFEGYQTDDLDYQEKVDAQRTNLFLARNLVSDALISLRSARQDYLGEVASLVSGSNGDYLRTALLQQERVNAAQARVNAALAEIGKSIIKAPFSGMVTKIDTEVGEIVSSNSPIISMISDAEFEIEAYIAEADISRVVVGSTAKVTLDAYGSTENFETELVFVDPAETVIDGVSTYRALLHFVKLDERIRSGMTADIEIITGESKGVLAVPQRALFDKDSKTLVKVFENGKIVEKEVIVGLKGFDGYVEIKEGLQEGEQVVIFSRD